MSSAMSWRPRVGGGGSCDTDTAYRRWLAGGRPRPFLSEGRGERFSWTSVLSLVAAVLLVYGWLSSFGVGGGDGRPVSTAVTPVRRTAVVCRDLRERRECVYPSGSRVVIWYRVPE